MYYVPGAILSMFYIYIYIYIYIYKFNSHNYTREKVVLTHFMNEETKAV